MLALTLDLELYTGSKANILPEKVHSLKAYTRCLSFAMQCGSKVTEPRVLCC